MPNAHHDFSRKVVKLPRAFPPLPPSLIYYQQIRRDAERADRIKYFLFCAGLLAIGFAFGWLLTL